VLKKRRVGTGMPDKLLAANVIKRGRKMKAIRLVKVLAVVVVLTALMVAAAEVVSAADRSPAGAVIMPADKTLSIKMGQSVKINFGYEYDYNGYYFFKIKPTKKGYITFNNDYSHGNCIALLNAKKKVISRDGQFDCFLSAGSSYPYQRNVSFGVNKGVTYYVRVKGASLEREAYGQPYIGTVKCTNTGISGIKFGKSKKKASKLKRKKVRNGVLVAGVNGAQWYKLKSVKKKTWITFSAKQNCGTVYARVYYKSGKKWYSNRMFAMRSDNAWKRKAYITSNRKKNTYYIKVYKKGNSSGKYTLQWK
jgi:hypothetical protein